MILAGKKKKKVNRNDKLQRIFYMYICCICYWFYLRGNDVQIIKQVSRMDRKEAIEILKRNKPTSDPRRCGTELCEAVDMAIEALKEPERKKGQWIILSSNEDSAVCKCSVCGEDFIFYNGKFFPNYCGYCGSDVRGEQE